MAGRATMFRQLGEGDPPMDNGTTSFMFVCTALVQFMTPGLALFYAGMQGYTSAVQTMAQNFVCLGLVAVLWVVYAFGLTFGTPMISIPLFGTDYNLLGNPSTYFMWQGVEIYEALHRASDIVVCCFPGMLFAAYQCMFAIITPALISGGITDRMHFGPYLIFVTLWLTLVYAPLGYWNWGGGWMFQIGAWDFAGGMVVHESAGFSTLGVLWVLGPRVYKQGESAEPAHNMTLLLTGTAILWFGWFGFNGGSALTIGGLATIAFVNTQLAPASGMMMWLLLDWVIGGRPTINGACAGVVAGLVVITPSAGFVQPSMAIFAGIIGAFLCFFSSEWLKHNTKLDDSCDTFGVHGMAGFLGTILVGVIADPAECANAKTAPQWCANPGTVNRSLWQAWIQTVCAVVSAAYSIIVSYIIVKVMYTLCFKRLSTWQEQYGTRDVAAFGENAYVIGLPDEEELQYYSSQGSIRELASPYMSQGSPYTSQKEGDPCEPILSLASLCSMAGLTIGDQGEEDVEEDKQRSTYGMLRPGSPSASKKRAKSPSA